MANPFPGVAIIDYNANPPPDDGSQTEANRVKWSTIKDKLNDPIKERQDTINSALIEAFEKVIGGGGLTSTAISYTVLSTDQGKLVRATAAGITITSPDATDVGDPFVFALLNDSAGDIIFDGSGTQTVDGDLTVVVPAGCGLFVFTDGANWFTNGQNFQRPLIAPQGYLTLLDVATSPTTPMPSSDQTAKAAVYYRPYGGNLMPIPDGLAFLVREFAELTLTLNSNHVANGIYDVFAFADPADNSIKIGTGPVWNTVTAGSGARGTGAGTTELDLLKGLLVNKLAMTTRNGATTYSIGAKSALFLGSIWIDGSAGQVSCHVTYGQSRKWGVSNAYNRKKVILKAGPATASWTAPAPSTVRVANADAANKLTTFCCLPEETIELLSLRRALTTTSVGTGGAVSLATGIGVNVANAYSGISAPQILAGTTGAGSDNSITLVTTSHHTLAPGIGINNINACENSSVSGSVQTFLGTESQFLLKATYQA